jgi:hypothetical protein
MLAAANTLSDCLAQNQLTGSFRDTPVNAEPSGSRLASRDVYVDQEIGLLLSVADASCQIIVQGLDTQKMAKLAYDRLQEQIGYVPAYQASSRGLVTEFSDSSDRTYISLIAQSTIPGTQVPSIEVTLARRSG